MKKSRLVVFGITVLTIFAVVFAGTPFIKDNMKLGLDLQGGFEILYEVSPLEGDELPSMAAVAESVNKRIDVLGVNEPEITVEGDNRIRVQLAGVKDADQARRIISSTANLTFRDVNDNLLMDATVLKEGAASVGYDNYGNPIVSLELADQAKFYEVTTKVAAMSDGQNLMVAWLDWEEGDTYQAEAQKENPKFISAASVQEGINSTSAMISGSFSQEEAKELAGLINSGSLPVKMTETYTNAVTAEYGVGAFSSTMIAGAIGVIAIMIFMILYYRVAGIISSITLAAYVFVVFLIQNLMGATFTLSGIAALVLGVGMAVDSNILTFERIKDSLYTGRSVKKAFYEGSSKSFITILDAQITTFISAVILYVFGTGSVKGFATMLIVSTVSTLLVIVFVTKFLLKQLVESGKLDGNVTAFGAKPKFIPEVNKNQERFHFGHFTKIDFVGMAKKFWMISGLILALAIVFMGVNGASGKGVANLGIDFASGTKITVTSDAAIDKTALDKDLTTYGIDANSIKISGQGDTIATVFVKEAVEQNVLDEAKTFLKDTYSYDVSDSTVTPVIGKELVRKAVIISVLAWIAIMIYISLRFKWDYAISGILGLIHDILIVLSAAVILRLEINIEIIAVMLTIIGYSINNSIVVFDRIRNQVKEHKSDVLSKDAYKRMVNNALSETAGRSILSTFTTILPVIALLFFGSGSIFTFCLLLLVGMIAGAGSSLFVAAQIWYNIRINQKHQPKKKFKHKKDEVEEMIIPGLNDF